MHMAPCLLSGSRRAWQALPSGNRIIGMPILDAPRSVYTLYRMKTRVAKWGNSLALRLPKALVETHGLEAGRESWRRRSPN